jgi:hypothetical protein
MNRFVLKNTFIKIYIYHFSINILNKNKKLKLCIGDRVIVQSDFFYKPGESIIFLLFYVDLGFVWIHVTSYWLKLKINLTFFEKGIY